MRILSARSLLILAAAAIAPACGGVSAAQIAVNERVEADGGTPVDVHLLVQPEHARSERRFLRAAAATIAMHCRWLGPQPHAALTIVDPVWRASAASGPDGTVVLGRTPWWTTTTAMAPEIATTRAVSRWYWTSLVDTAALPPWFVDGLAEFGARRVVASLFEQENLPPGYAFVEERYFGRFVPLRIRVRLLPETDGDPMPAYRASPRVAPPAADASGDAALSLRAKTVLALGTLERWVGRPVFDQIAAAFVRDSRGRRPTLDDFRRVASDVSGQDLTWFFGEAFESPRVFDYSVERLTSEPDRNGGFETTVVARRYGDAMFTGSSATPIAGFERGRGIALRVTFADGTQRTDYWDGRAAEKIFGYHSRDRAVSAAVDPDRTLLLDLEQGNNSKTIGRPREGAATRWAGRYMIWLENLLLTVAALA